MTQQQDYQDTGDYGYEYDDEDYEGWLWDETTQQWIEDPNWVDPNQQPHTSQSHTDNTQNNGKHTYNQPNTNANATAQPRPSPSNTQTQNQPQPTTNTNATTNTQQPPKSSRSKMRPQDIKREKQMLTEANQNKGAKIDETNIPRVQISNKVTVYECTPKLDTLPPGSREPYIAHDLGNATPRHIRMTLYNIPLSGDTADKCSLALAAVIQPIANIGLQEKPIEIVNMGSEGPIRCVGCRAYMNPHVLWIADGTRWICNLCQLTNDCPTWYRKNLDGKYQRRDRLERPELHRGSVDYVAPNDLVKQMQYEPGIFFVIDVSCVALKRDLVQLTVATIRDSVMELREQYRVDVEEKSADVDGNKCILRVGFLTYDNKIHFHALSNGALHVISEVKDPFVSLPDSEILIPLMDDNKFAEWERLLLRVPKLFEHNRLTPESENKSCLGAALYSATQVLHDCGGKVIAQQTSLPNIGIGALKFRDAVELHGSDKERELYVSSNPFYPNLTNECATNFISVDIFCCASGYCDLASIGEMSRKTGGQIYYYSNFNKNKDGLTFTNDMRTNLLRKTVYRSVMAIRASKGLEVVDYFGNFFLTENQEIQLPVVTSDTALAVSIRHYEKLNSGTGDEDGVPAQVAAMRNKHAALQVAMLYLDGKGMVYIRVHTLSMPIVRRIADVFRCVDMDTVLNVSLKQCAQELVSAVSSTMTVAAARKSLVSACVDILFVYRRYCASNNAQRQLVLPEALKLLPLFTLGLLKNGLLSDGVSVDERAYHISYSLHMPCYQSLTYIHPYLYPMHNVLVSNKECIVSESGRVLLPKAITLKYQMLKNIGLYAMDTGRKIYICIGPDLSSKLFEQCFTQNMHHKEERIELKQDFEDGNINDLGYRFSLILDELRYDKPYWLNIEILLLPNTKDHDSILTMDQHEFLKHLIEDASRIQTRNTNSKNPANMSYVDFLVYIHKEIQKKFIDL